MSELHQTADGGSSERSLTAEELDSALKLLSAEADPSAGSRLWKELLEDVLLGFFFFGLGTGLVIVWFDKTWGFGLLAVAVVSFVLFMVTPLSNLQDELERIRTTLGNPESAKAAAEVWTRRVSLGSSIPFVAQAVVLLGGVAWLIQGLIADGQVVVVALVMIAISVVSFWVVFAFDQIREVQYYEQVESILHRLEERGTGEGEPEIAVSKAELDVLAKAEHHQTRLTVNASAQQASFVLENSYAVSITEGAIDELEQLHASNTRDWLGVREAIRSLEDDPRPSSAHQASALAASMKLVAGQYEVEYVVDDANRSVSVVRIVRGTFQSDAR
jgi:phosphate starvation-inducible membrane PsiE